MSFIEDIAVPEMNKMAKADVKAKPIFKFLEWLEKEKNVSMPEPHTDLLYAYFGVDKDKAAREMAQLKEAAKERREKHRKDLIDRVRASSVDDLSIKDAGEIVGSMIGLPDDECEELLNTLPEDHRKRIKELLKQGTTDLDNLLNEANEEGDEDE